MSARFWPDPRPDRSSGDPRGNSKKHARMTEKKSWQGARKLLGRRKGIVYPGNMLFCMNPLLVQGKKARGAQNQSKGSRSSSTPTSQEATLPPKDPEVPGDPGELLQHHSFACIRPQGIQGLGGRAESFMEERQNRQSAQEKLRRQRRTILAGLAAAGLAYAAPGLLSLNEAHAYSHPSRRSRPSHRSRPSRRSRYSRSRRSRRYSRYTGPTHPSRYGRGRDGRYGW